MTAFVPPGWPNGVQPPQSPEFERSAVTWLLDVVPSDYLLHGVLRRHPIALAALARHHLSACVDGARSGYRTARSELGPHLPPSAVEAVLAAYRSEGGRLAAATRAADLVERALHGEVFVRHMGGGARSSGHRQATHAERGADRTEPPGRPMNRAASAEQSQPPSRVKSRAASAEQGQPPGQVKSRATSTRAGRGPARNAGPGQESRSASA